MTLDQAFDFALAHHRAGRLAEAEQLYRQILAVGPQHADALHLLGVIASQTGQHDEAIALIQKVIALAPGQPACHSNLGLALRERGRLEEAVAAYREALRLKPDYAEAHNNLGIVLLDLGRIEEAIAAHREALRWQPDNAEAQHNLGVALAWSGRLDEATGAYRRALELKPDYADVHNNLGNALKDQGRIEEAVAAYRRTLEIKPEFVPAHDNLLLLLHCLPDANAATIYREHRRWNEKHALPLAGEIAPHRNDPNPARRLRIGYVSPDFREHAVACFFEGLLSHHDRAAVEVFGYAELRRGDHVTARLREKCAGWREITGLPDAQIAEFIRQDGIDILVDLAGHTGHNRLLVFARKPAPVQVSYLGYCDTTGMDVMDYRLTDAHADPPGMTEQFHSERLVRLPQSAWCFRPAVEFAISPLPCRSAGYVTFGSFCSLPKITGAMLTLWSRILQALPHSRLLLKNLGLREPMVRERIRAAFAGLGIAPDRIALVEANLPVSEHFSAYGGMDVALDTFPYHGTTTTCEALWMGVPIITLAGRTHASRVGVSLLTSIGLPELIAENEEDYVRRAVDLAADVPRLANLRAALRERMVGSPLMQPAPFARAVESAYREMWREWCARR